MTGRRQKKEEEEEEEGFQQSSSKVDTLKRKQQEAILPECKPLATSLKYFLCFRISIVIGLQRLIKKLRSIE